MSILNRKRRIKCSVQFTIQELLSVPFINGILFCKLRLVEGGHFTAYSSKKEILHSSVVWNFDINFEVKINTSMLNADLYEPCICRISVRKEIRGGKSFQKLGFIDYNLSDFINKQETSLNRVLKEYDSKNRLDNSFLKVKIRVNEITQQQTQTAQANSAANIRKSISPTSFSGVNSLLKQKTQQQQLPTSSSISSSSSSSSPSTTIQQQQQTSIIKHQEIIEYLSNNSTDNNNPAASSTQTVSHSRNSSKSSAVSFEKGHHRNVSNSSTTSNNSYDTTSTRSKNKKLIEELQSKDANIRILETRIDAHEIINQVESELASRDLITPPPPIMNKKLQNS